MVKKWWDYTGYFLNLHGRICAEGLLVFGVGGMAFVYVIAPLIDNWVKEHLNKKIIYCLFSFTSFIWCRCCLFTL